MSKSLQVKILRTKNLGRRYARSAHRCGLSNDYATRRCAQGQMSHRGVEETSGKNHFGRLLRRGIALNFGMVPPREASRRALSRSMRAFSASRIKAVFSVTPVNSWVIRTRSSSRASVVVTKASGTDYRIRGCEASCHRGFGG